MFSSTDTAHAKTLTVQDYVEYFYQMGIHTIDDVVAIPPKDIPEKFSRLHVQDQRKLEANLKKLVLL